MNKQIIGLISLAVIFVLVANFASASRTGGNGSNYFSSNSDGLGTIYYNTGPVGVGGSGSNVASFFVQGYSNFSYPIFAVASSSGMEVFSVSNTGSTTKMMRYVGYGTPTVATSTGSGSVAGTTTLSVGSSDLAGSIYLTTGSVPGINTTIVTFISASSTDPFFCILQPMNKNTAQLYAASSTSMSTTTTGFIIKSGSIGLISTTTYQWNYLCN
jgi:hypothetical protein